VASFFFTFLKIFLNGQEGPFVCVWLVLSDLIASFGPLSGRRLDRLFLSQSHRETPISESAGLVEKQAHLRWFRVKAELGRPGSPVTIFPRGIP
jgi:hypothetical protein